MTPKQYNQIIDEINWGKNTDCESLGEMLLTKYPKTILRAFQKKYYANLDKVIKTLNRHSKLKCGDKYGYFPVSDDGFSDLTCHIAGLSKERFDAILANPELALAMAEKLEYKENFCYIFQTVFPEDYR